MNNRDLKYFFVTAVTNKRKKVMSVFLFNSAQISHYLSYIDAFTESKIDDYASAHTVRGYNIGDNSISFINEIFYPKYKSNIHILFEKIKNNPYPFQISEQVFDELKKIFKGDYEATSILLKRNRYIIGML